MFDFDVFCEYGVKVVEFGDLGIVLRVCYWFFDDYEGVV